MDIRFRLKKIFIEKKIPVTGVRVVERNLSIVTTLDKETLQVIDLQMIDNDIIWKLTNS